MQCMNCSNIALENKALCEECLADTKNRLIAKQQAWRDGSRASDEKPKDITISSPSAPHVSRLLAFLIDSLSLSILSFLIFSLVSRLLINHNELASLKVNSKDPLYLAKILPTIKSLAMLNLSISIFPAWVYYVFFECSGSKATLGKQLLGLQVCPIKEINLALSSNRFYIKNISYIAVIVFIPFLSSGIFSTTFFTPTVLTIFAVITAIGLLNPFMILFSSRRRGLHDLVGRTQVVQDTPISSSRFVLALIILLSLTCSYLALIFFSK